MCNKDEDVCLGGIPLDTWQRSGRARFARMQALNKRAREQEGERGMSWMTLIVIELLGGVGGGKNREWRC